MSHKKGIDKKLLIGPTHGFNLQFLNLFGFSISVGFVSQVQHGMGPLINMQKISIFAIVDNYELNGRKILHIESFSVIESENLARIS